MPSAPRGLKLRLVEANPPVVAVQWSTPRQTYGDLSGYKLSFSIHDDDSKIEERRFEADKYRFTTGFLGNYPTVVIGKRKSASEIIT